MPSPRVHRYEVEVTWTGNSGAGTTGYRDYERHHEITGVNAPGKPTLPGSADPGFRGVPERWNPEELLVASLSQCHMLWYLALCARSGIVVVEYLDRPYGTMIEDSDGSGRFQEVVLRPEVTVTTRELADEALAMHQRSHEMCFIANSVNFPVRHVPTISTADA